MSLKPRGQLLLSSGQPDAEFNDGRHGLLVEGQKFLVIDDPLDEAGELVGVFLRVRHHGVEMGLGLENLLEVTLQVVEELVEVVVAQHDDLDVQRDRFRLEGGRGKIKRIIGL